MDWLRLCRLLCSVVTTVVPEHVLSFTRTFGENIQGQTSPVFFAASHLTAMLCSLDELIERIEVYHKFWFAEATNLVPNLGIQMKLPEHVRRAQQDNLESQLVSERSSGNSKCPTVEHTVQGLKESQNSTWNLFHAYLWCLQSWGRSHFIRCGRATPVPTEVACPVLVGSQPRRTVKESSGNTEGKVQFPSTTYKALHLTNINFFPNVCTLLKVPCISVMKVENEYYEK